MNVKKFKQKTSRLFRTIEGYSSREIESMLRMDIENLLMDMDATIKEVLVVGSRCRGLEKETSDLDILVYLDTEEREDDLFNLLNEEPFLIGNIKVDINPITTNETGSLETYLSEIEKYLEKKR